MNAHVSRRQFLERCTMGLAGFALGGCAETSTQRPNLLFLLTDDQRGDTLGYAGNPVIKTPHLDRLAQDGVLFSNCFVTTSICPSSRASILTGLYTRRHRVGGFGVSLSDEAVAHSYPALLRAAGYQTGFVGKWGLGGAPPGRMFDFIRAFSGQHGYFHEIEGRQQHLTGLLADAAIDFLRRAGEKPFCLSVSFKAPHVPRRDFDPVFRDLYRGVPMPVPENASEADIRRIPDFIRESRNGSWARQAKNPAEAVQVMTRRYYRLISGVDTAVGRLMEALASEKLRRRTVVIFTSDNGVLLGEHGLTGKWLMYEGAIRVPLILSDPAIPEARRGQRCEALALNVDLAPTLLAYAGLQAPPAMQGMSLIPLARGATTEWRKDFYYEMPAIPSERVLACEGVRTERWKYVRYPGRKPVHESLFDLQTDPNERHDLVGEPGAADTLAQLRLRWKEHPARL